MNRVKEWWAEKVEKRRIGTNETDDIEKVTGSKVKVTTWPSMGKKATAHPRRRPVDF